MVSWLGESGATPPGNGSRPSPTPPWQRIAPFPAPQLRQVTAVAANSQGDRILLISPRRASIAVVANDSLDAGRIGAAVAGMIRALRASGRIADYNATENVVVGLVNSAVTRRGATDALALAQLATEMFPASYRAFAVLGDTYKTSGDTTAAVANWRKSLELNPRRTEADKAAAAAVEKKIAGGSSVPRTEPESAPSSP